MTYIEGPGVVYNTQYNNNIAWKNQMIMDATHTHGPIDIHNGTTEDRPQTLIFTVPDGERADDILNHATVTVDLGQAVMADWRAHGSKGRNVTDLGGTAIRIDAFDASVTGIKLSAGATENLAVDVTFPDPPNKNDAGKVFHMDLTQWDNDGGDPTKVNHLVGGENFTVTMPDVPGGKNIRLNDNAVIGHNNDAFARALQLTVHPNPTRGATTINYTLPADTRVTVAIYDVTGKLVRTLVEGADQQAGTHTIEWDGKAAGDKAAASGTYFYRIETPRGTAQQQLGVAR
jgi:hypothetical protein